MLRLESLQSVVYYSIDKKLSIKLLGSSKLVIRNENEKFAITNMNRALNI